MFVKMLLKALPIVTVFILGSGVFAQDSTKTWDRIDPNIEVPNGLSAFDPVFHFPPVNQGRTSTCWSFATVSFLETEMARLKMPTVKLAMMYPVYYGYVEKAKYFVQTKGESRFSPGDLFTTVLDVVQAYGILPEKNYTGLIDPGKTYNHRALDNELKACITRVKEEGLWDETEVIDRVASILNKHLGKPPETFDFEGQTYTPKSFQAKFVNLPWKEYVLVTSFQYAPFYTFTDLRVPDNWRKHSGYYNVPLEVFYEGLKGALQAGCSVAFNGDISEPGRVGQRDIAIVPTNDIPHLAIAQQTREYQFNKKMTTDDHLMHMVGLTESGGHDWFLVKDSWHDAWEGKYKGYFMYRDDFARLKIMAYLVHKDALPTLSID